MENNTTENNTDRADSTAKLPAPTVGEMLSEARERLGLTVMDVATQIKFAPKQIEALEANDFQRLPEQAFLRGFVRSYAKLLHLDAQPLIAALPQEKAAPGSLLEATGEAMPGARAAQRQNLIWLGASLVMIAIVAGFAAWHLSTPPQEAESPEAEAPVTSHEELKVDPGQLAPEPAAGVPASTVVAPAPAVRPQAPAARTAVPAVTATPPQPAPQAPALQSPALQSPAAPTAEQPAAPVELSTLYFMFNGESWTEIRDREGKILSSRAHEPGGELRVRGAAPFTLTIGNAFSVRLFYDDKEIDLIPHTRVSSGVANLTLE